MKQQLRGLRSFCLVAKYLSFKQAADELCLTASAVSHQIGDLESQLGCKLFRRQARSIVLTTKGRQLFQQIDSHMEAIDDAVTRIKQDSEREPLLVQMPEFFASELLMPLIGEFSEGHRSIELQIESLENAAHLHPRAQINIVLSRKQPDGSLVEQLFPIHYIPASCQALREEWEKNGLNLASAIDDSTLILHKARPDAWNQWAAHAGIKRLKPKQIIYVDTMFAQARAAERGVGIALVPMPVSRAWFESGALVSLHDKELVTEDYYWMVLNENVRHSASTQKLWRWILGNFQQPAPYTNEINSFVA